MIYLSTECNLTSLKPRERIPFSHSFPVNLTVVRDPIQVEEIGLHPMRQTSAQRDARDGQRDWVSLFTDGSRLFIPFLRWKDAEEDIKLRIQIPERHRFLSDLLDLVSRFQESNRGPLMEVAAHPIARPLPGSSQVTWPFPYEPDWDSPNRGGSFLNTKDVQRLIGRSVSRSCGDFQKLVDAVAMELAFREEYSDEKAAEILGRPFYDPGIIEIPDFDAAPEWRDQGVGVIATPNNTGRHQSRPYAIPWTLRYRNGEARFEDQTAPRQLTGSQAPPPEVDESSTEESFSL